MFFIVIPTLFFKMKIVYNNHLQRTLKQNRGLNLFMKTNSKSIYEKGENEEFAVETKCAINSKQKIIVNIII